MKRKLRPVKTPKLKEVALKEKLKLEEKLAQEAEDDDYENIANVGSDSEDELEAIHRINNVNTEDSGYEDDELPEKELLPEIDPVYDSDETDEEENAVGSIPLEWYEEHDHMGYDKDGNKIMKPSKSELDTLLSQLDDPETAQSVFDKFKQANIKLGKEELELIRNVASGSYPQEPADEPTVEWFTSQVSPMPLSAAPEPKRRFVPSKWEARKIMKIVRAIRKGLFDPNKKITKETGPYKIWNEDDESNISSTHLPAPKALLPDHAHSYNPPAEYVMTENEIKEWEQMDPEDRDYNFIIKKYNNLRSVPGYNRFIQERFERCLDLYLCPRVKGKTIHTDPDKLLPKLPDPRDLQPFPQTLVITYKGHNDKVRCISVDPAGVFLASGAEDGVLKIWEISSGRCLQTVEFPSAILALVWNPNKSYGILAVSCGTTITLFNAKVHSRLIKESNESLITSGNTAKSNNQYATWRVPSKDEQNRGELMQIELHKAATSVSWHRRGDYFVSVSPEATSSAAVQIHQITKRQSLCPFKKFKSQVQHVVFHPSKPILFVATKQHVLVYELTKQERLKTLMSGVKWISSIDIHPLGDNLIIGSYDRRLCWFDLDLSSMPYKTLRYHNHAVRKVVYHKKYPLFVSCGDDGRVNVFHGKVFPDDLMRQPMIVPVKVINAHSVVGNHGTLDCEFHPTQPWLFSSGADNTVKLFT
ncbi:Ribosome biogenesis protein 1 [Nowakowskiella sp. JEL0407]|nr:Ribosome biogenesis protein 1 [Nowakowskiella sp. JEL0407]